MKAAYAVNLSPGFRADESNYADFAAMASALPARQQTVQLQIQAIGTVEAYTVVSVRAQVGGELTRVHIKEGQDVRKGDLLFTIDPRTAQSVVQEFAGQGFGAFKPALADLLIETLAPIRARLQDFEADPAALEAILVAGSEKAAAMAAPTLEGAYRALGLPR